MSDPKISYLHWMECDIPLYRGKLVVILSNDVDAIREKIPVFDEESDLYAHCVATNWKGFQGFCLVFNSDNHARPVTYGTIFHEAVHATSMICNERGISADHDNDEAFAYLAEWVADRVLEFFKEKGLSPSLEGGRRES